MKKICKMIDKIMDELHGARSYAEKWVEYMNMKTTWAKMYHEMAEQELNHAKYLKVMLDEFYESMGYKNEKTVKAYEDAIEHYARCVGEIKMILG